MVGLFGMAIYYVQKPQIHKRLMLLLMIAMMTPAIARGLFLLAQQSLTVPFAASAVWMSMARAFQSLSG